MKKYAEALEKAALALPVLARERDELRAENDRLKQAAEKADAVKTAGHLAPSGTDPEVWVNSLIEGGMTPEAIKDAAQIFPGETDGFEPVGDPGGEEVSGSMEAVNQIVLGDF